MDPRSPRVAARLDAPDCLPGSTPPGPALPVSRLPEAASMVPVATFLIPFRSAELVSVRRGATFLSSSSSSHPEPGTLPCSPRRPTSHGAAARQGSRLAEGDTTCSALTPARATGARLLIHRRFTRRGPTPSRVDTAARPRRSDRRTVPDDGYRSDSSPPCPTRSSSAHRPESVCAFVLGASNVRYIHGSAASIPDHSPLSSGARAFSQPWRVLKRGTHSP